MPYISVDFQWLKLIRARALLAALCAVVFAPTPLAAEEAKIGVATNFASTFEALEAAFEAQSDHELVGLYGATGQLYAQIVNGAPIDVFLAADKERPSRLVRAGRARADSQYTYARGRLALWWRDRALSHDDVIDALRADGRIALANPRLAPYGFAAREALRALGVLPQARARLVLGQNVGQAFALVASKNAAAGFVAYSALLSTQDHGGAFWLVPDGLYSPIEQDAVLLTRGQDNAAATEFMAFLKSDTARAIISAAGYADFGGDPSDD